MLRVDLAREEDDPALRQLLRQTPMPGSIELCLTREPSFFHGAAIEGDSHYTFLARRRDDGTPLAMASLAVYDGWLDRKPARLGYLSQMRIAPFYRGHMGIKRGFAHMRELFEELGLTFAVSTIFEANTAVRAMLERDSAAKPRYEPWGALTSMSLPVPRRPPQPRERGFTLRRATDADLDAIAALLQEAYAPFQLAPCWTAAHLRSDSRTRGLAPQDFVVAETGSRLLGCAALWDQRSFKQTVVLGYHGATALLRPLVNVLGPLTGWPELPAPGSVLGQAFISHLAVVDRRVDVALALIDAHRAHAAERRGEYDYLVLGVCDGHPLREALVKNLRHIAYRSRIYLVHWPEAAAMAARLDRGLPGFVEVAVL